MLLAAKVIWKNKLRIFMKGNVKLITLIKHQRIY